MFSCFYNMPPSFHSPYMTPRRVQLMNFSNLRRYVFGSLPCFNRMFPILTRLYKSGSRAKLSANTLSLCSSARIFSSVHGSPLSIISSGMTARPASVISPERSRCRHLSLLSSVQLLPFFLGVILCNVLLSWVLTVESIHPKHKTSYTMSR